MTTLALAEKKDREVGPSSCCPGAVDRWSDPCNAAYCEACDRWATPPAVIPVHHGPTWERDPDTATRYSVFTLPTTVLVDADGRVRHVNYGLTDANKLGRQLAEVVEQSAMFVPGRQTTDHGPQPESAAAASGLPSSVVRRLSSLFRATALTRGSS